MIDTFFWFMVVKNITLKQGWDLAHALAFLMFFFADCLSDPINDCFHEQSKMPEHGH